MRIQRKLVATFLGAALVLTACGGGGSTEPSASDDDGSTPSAGDGEASSEVAGEINLLTPLFEGSSGQDALEGEILPAFYEEYPDVTVNVEYTTYGNLNERLTTAVASGLMPDVLMMGVGWIEPFASQGVLKDLGEFGITVEGLSEDIEAAVLRAAQYDGKLYGIPLMLDARFGIYRKSMFEEAGLDPEQPPTSWDELREYAIQLTVRDADGNLERAGLDLFAHDLRQIWMPFLFSNGGELFDESGQEVRFNSPEGVEALAFLDQLVNEDRVTEVGFETGTDLRLMQVDQAAMMIGHNDIWRVAEESTPEILDDLGAFVINEDRQAFFHGGTIVNVAESTDNPEAAIALAQHLAAPEAALIANEQRGNVPVHKDLLDSDYVQNNALVRFVMENLQYAFPEGGTEAWMEARGNFATALEEALLQVKTPEEALDDLARLTEEAIAR
jgi:multiple sugar transport system substrate-binding protein